MKIMQPLKINITPTALCFRDLTESGHIHLVKELNLTYSDKGYYFLRDIKANLFDTLLKLSYTYDIELS